jgi:hypothetical protein
VRITLALALFVVIACKPPLDDHSTILPLSEMWTMPPSKGAKPYTPTADDIRRFRGALPSAVPPAIAGRAPNDYGQFIGYVEKGQRWIHGNFACRIDDEAKSYWRKSYYSVSDGGACYFHIEWSPDTNATRNLSVNGEA